MRAVLGETFRLLVAHLNLFTLISLTVWLPAHVLRNYFEFFQPAEVGPAQSLRVMLSIHVVFDPLVVAATVAALGQIAQGQPVGYPIAMLRGLAAWGRLLVVRFALNVLMALPALGALSAAAMTSGVVQLAAGAVLVGLAIVIAVLVVRVSIIDSVVVLEGENVVTAWRRAAALTAGQRWTIVLTLGSLFAIVIAFALLAAQVVHVVRELDHFVVRVLLDCAVAVSQSCFTIALFLFYRRARSPGEPPIAMSAASSRDPA